MLLVVNAYTSEVTMINNSDKIHELGSCNPIAGFVVQQVDAIVVVGIGRSTRHMPKISGSRVFRGHLGTIDKNMELFKADDLPEFMPGHSCGGHGHDHECSH